MGQAKRKLSIVGPERTEPYETTVSLRSTKRLLEKYCLAMGSRTAADAAAQVAAAHAQAYNEDLSNVAEAPEGARCEVDFTTGVVKVTPRKKPPAPDDDDQAEESS